MITKLGHSPGRVRCLSFVFYMANKTNMERQSNDIQRSGEIDSNFWIQNVKFTLAFQYLHVSKYCLKLLGRLYKIPEELR